MWEQLAPSFNVLEAFMSIGSLRNSTVISSALTDLRPLDKVNVTN